MDDVQVDVDVNDWLSYTFLDFQIFFCASYPKYCCNVLDDDPDEGHKLKHVGLTMQLACMLQAGERQSICSD